MDGSQREDCVVLTLGQTDGTISAEQRKAPESVAFGLLYKLAEGRPVVLRVDDQRLFKRKRAEKPVLFLTPLSVYGPPSSMLMVSLPAHGSELIETKDDIRAISFMRLGLSASLSKAIASELNKVFTVRRSKS